jgi:2-dehydro-3-deoxygalactonokinase
MSDTRLIALDWGTTQLRARLLGAGGAVLAERSTPSGIMHVPEGRFEQALRDTCGDWIDAHGCALLASGMIGSRQGWQEAPYLDLPASLEDAAARLTRVDFGASQSLFIVPGLLGIGDDGQSDVMRGEETQLWGCALPDGACGVLPGTHSKWAWIGPHGRITAFQTWMTGELFALLRQHSILGRLMTPGDFAPAAFDDGVRLGLERPAQMMHTIFAARTAGLTARRPPDALADFLSGILIGAEIGGAHSARPVEAVTLVGEAALCNRYARALAAAGVAAARAPADTTARGQWRVARAARLLEER